MRWSRIQLWLRGEKGFTLIELLAGLAITSLMLGIASAVFLTGQKAVYQNGIVLEMQQSSRLSMQFMLREIRTSQQILAVKPNTITLVNKNNNKIVYRMGGGTLWRDFYLQPSSIYKSTSHPLANQVIDLFFESCGGNGVKVRLTVGQGDRIFTLDTVVSPRVNVDP